LLSLERERVDLQAVIGRLNDLGAAAQSDDPTIRRQLIRSVFTRLEASTDQITAWEPREWCRPFFLALICARPVASSPVRGTTHSRRRHERRRLCFPEHLVCDLGCICRRYPSEATEQQADDRGLLLDSQIQSPPNAA